MMLNYSMQNIFCFVFVNAGELTWGKSSNGQSLVAKEETFGMIGNCIGRYNYEQLIYSSLMGIVAGFEWDMINHMFRMICPLVIGQFAMQHRHV